jgi:hypothetical protein
MLGAEDGADRVPSVVGQKIEFPPLAQVGQSYQIIKCCHAIESLSDQIVLDLSRCRMLGPIATTLLALALARRHDKGLPPATVVPAEDAEVAHFLDEIAFERFLQGKGRSAQSGAQWGTREMRQLMALDPNFVEAVADLLADRVPGTSHDASYFVQLCMNELLQNVFEHSFSKFGCFLHCRWYKKSANARIAVVDGGIGIPAALRREQVEQLHREDDAHVIVAAVTKEGLSSRRGRPGGLGLKHIHDIVTRREGTLTVISQSAKVEFKRQGPKIARTSMFFQGTAVEIDFRPQIEVPPSTADEEIL